MRFGRLSKLDGGFRKRNVCAFLSLFRAGEQKLQCERRFPATGWSKNRAGRPLRESERNIMQDRQPPGARDVALRQVRDAENWKRIH